MTSDLTKSHWPQDVFIWSSWTQSRSDGFKSAIHPSAKRQRCRVRWLALFFLSFVFFSLFPGKFTLQGQRRTRAGIIYDMWQFPSQGAAPPSSDHERLSLLPGRWWRTNVAFRSKVCRFVKQKHAWSDLERRHASAHSLTSLIFHFFFLLFSYW